MSTIHACSFVFALNMIVCIYAMRSVQMNIAQAVSVVIAVLSGGMMLVPMIGEIPDVPKALSLYCFVALVAMFGFLALALFEKQIKRSRVDMWVNVGMMFANLAMSAVTITEANLRV